MPVPPEMNFSNKGGQALLLKKVMTLYKEYFKNFDRFKNYH